jgi:hypothetical protein
MATTTAALLELSRALDAPRNDLGAWRWTVRRRLGAVRDVLLREPAARRNAWLSARTVRSARERDALLRRIDRLAKQVLDCEDVAALAAQLSRLNADIARHDQRLHDLAYDDVELEIGGSE